ncbi:hypothetical protein [Secundilactobacillus kimchicus]|uniref:hypothetical protein n=1 Tax=Secundilactobacillus kimchicus TaxID=528209 RepID=UPI0024A7B763|nr:hypothetical protein [Secundilactobacillus kimchicus]
MLNSLNTRINDDGTTNIKYSLTFAGAEHECYGEFNASAEDTTEAFKGATASDTWAGFKVLVMKQLMTDCRATLGGDAK